MLLNIITMNITRIIERCIKDIEPDTKKVKKCLWKKKLSNIDKIKKTSLEYALIQEILYLQQQLNPQEKIKVNTNETIYGMIEEEYDDNTKETYPIIIKDDNTVHMSYDPHFNWKHKDQHTWDEYGIYYYSNLYQQYVIENKVTGGRRFYKEYYVKNRVSNKLNVYKLLCKEKI
jgi:hypothetical protein